MRFKGFWYDSLLICVTAAFAAAFTALTAFVEPRLAVAEAIAFLTVFGIALCRAIFAKKRYKKFLLRTAKKLDFTDKI